MSIKVCGHRLLVQPYKQEEVDEVLRKATESGFLKDFQIINSNKKREDLSVDKGVVLQIGPTAWNDASLGGIPWCNVGDVIYFAKFAGKDIDGLFVLNDEDVVAVETQDE